MKTVIASMNILGSPNPYSRAHPATSLPMAGMQTIGITVVWAVTLARRALERGAYSGRVTAADISGLCKARGT